VTYSLRLREQAFDGDLGQTRHRISESLLLSYPNGVREVSQ
jgi:hypothetical protein